MKTFLSFLSIVVAANAWAQFGGPPQRDNSGERLARLFGKKLAFTATAHVVITDSKGREKEDTEMAYALLDGKLRTEINTAKTSTGKKHAKEMEMADQMGMGQMVILVRPDKSATYLVYPGMKAYCEAPGSKKSDKEGKTETTDLGQEKIDTHPCTKQKVVVTYDDGSTDEMIQWLAKDLKDFPVQTQMQSGKDTVTTTFRDIKHGKPDASLFEIPADYTGYNSMQELMMSAAQRMMGGQ